jgi:hypothetical protein
VGNKQWTINSEQWAMDSTVGTKALPSRQWPVKSGQHWAVNSGKWTVGSGQ